jgi:nicotianamine synthase
MKFPYYENYLDLTRMELSAIHAVTPITPQKIAFIGSGPLPLSSICLYQALNTSVSPFTVLNIDHDHDALVQSSSLCQKLGHGGMQFVCEAAGSLQRGLEEFDVVYLAALVGSTQLEKEKLLVSVAARMKEGSLLVVRSAHGLRTLLYPVRRYRGSRIQLIR